jgi:polyhydroxyalkanoate synthesis regulator phasin
MRRLAFTLLLLALASAYGAAKNETVDELKSRVESARPEDRPELCIRIARRQLGNADKLYSDGKAEEARATVDDIVTYSEKARDAATQTKKRLKNVEIDVRKIADKLRDIKRTLAFEDQAPVDQAVRRLEDIRTALLKEMFAKDSKKEKK